jgi:hypothetical protein
MKGWIYFLCVVTIIAACGPKRKGANEDTPTNPGSSALLKKFESVTISKLPFYFKDSLLDKDEVSKNAISWKDFTAEVPDTIFNAEFGKGVQPKIYPVGLHFYDDNVENYVFIKAVDGDKKVGYVLCFDGMEKYKDALAVVYTDFDYKTKFFATLTKEYTIDQIKEATNDKNEALSYRVSYIYNNTGNNTGSFITLLTTDNDANTGEPLYNPIDTLPAKNKFCGDFGDNNNIVSIRDGNGPNSYVVFVHTSLGEINGPAVLVGNDTIRYLKGGDMCQLNIIVKGDEVKINEQNPCGNHRKAYTEFSGVFDKIGKKAEAKQSIDQLKQLLRPSNIVRPLPKVLPNQDSLNKIKQLKANKPKRKDSLANNPEIITTPDNPVAPVDTSGGGL